MMSGSHPNWSAVAVLALGLGALGAAAKPEPSKADIKELWVDPGNIAARDVFHGEGGRRLVPSTDRPFEIEAVDRSGYSGGYTVKDTAGREWDVKIGKEAQPEVVSSRILWTIGYHQPVMHFVHTWTIKGDTQGAPTGRFRLQSDHDSAGDWSWKENPFVGTRELKGLLVANLLVNNWDLKPSQNRIYERPGGPGDPARWFVVQDIGASLGGTSWPTGNRNDIDDFEGQDLVVGVENGIVQFDYHARHKELFADITPADVVWVCRLLDRITDTQWADIFRAATYDPQVAQRYIAKLEAKIAQGLALNSGTRRQP